MLLIVKSVTLLLPRFCTELYLLTMAQSTRAGWITQDLELMFYSSPEPLSAPLLFIGVSFYSPLTYKPTAVGVCKVIGEIRTYKSVVCSLQVYSFFLCCCRSRVYLLIKEVTQREKYHRQNMVDFLTKTTNAITKSVKPSVSS